MGNLKHFLNHIAVKQEEILEDPRKAAEQIQAFLGLDQSAIEKMASVVRKRSPLCAKEMEELTCQ